MDSPALTERLEAIVIAAVEDLNPDLKSPIAVELGAEAPLFGQEGVLDSMGLVNLIVVVEQAIEDELKESVMLADDRALARSSSPFRSIGSLAAYAEDLIRKRT